MDQLMTTGEVARLLAVSEAWVREHGAELGGIRGADDSLRFERRRLKERAAIAVAAAAAESAVRRHGSARVRHSGDDEGRPR